MKNKEIYKIFLLFALIFRLEAQSIRDCLLLPIHTTPSEIGAEIFESLERDLREGRWCNYKSSSQVIDILSQYGRNFKEHIKEPKVLELISQKSDAGSLIGISVQRSGDIWEINVQVFSGARGVTYFKKTSKVQADSTSTIINEVKKILRQYQDTIPYDGLVEQVLGDTFTASIGKHLGAKVGMDVYVHREIESRKHPLLRNVIVWETEKIAQAKIEHAEDQRSQLKILTYFTEKRLKLKDWVLLDKSSLGFLGEKPPQKFPRDQYSYGKFGVFQMSFLISSNSVKDGELTKELSGLNLGGQFGIDLWITRHFWVGFSWEQYGGSASKEHGLFIEESPEFSSEKTLFKLGYRYLPLGFFYGPQLNFYGGLKTISYDLNSAQDGLGEVELSGLALGLQGSMPLKRSYRMAVGLEFIPSVSFEEKHRGLSREADKASSYSFFFNFSYYYNLITTLDISIRSNVNEIVFASERSLDFRERVLKTGISYYF